MDAIKTGKFISELRKEKNLTQSQLAEALFVSDKAISRWETGKGFPEITNLECLADALGVSTSEILKGERFGNEITPKEVNEITTGSISAFKSEIKRNRGWNLLIGFLLSAVVITFIIVQLISPIHIAGAQNALEIDTLSDGRIVAVLNRDVAGCFVDDIREPESNVAIRSVSCYQTLWNKWFGDKQEKIVVIGDQADIGAIYYYPGKQVSWHFHGDNLDEQIYISDRVKNLGFSGVTTLPRLVYNYWLLIGGALGILGLLLYLLFRKKRVSSVILKATFLPIALAISIFLLLIGRRGQVYEAPFYLLGIVLLTIILYALFSALHYRWLERLRDKASTVE